MGRAVDEAGRHRQKKNGCSWEALTPVIAMQRC